MQQATQRKIGKKQYSGAGKTARERAKGEIASNTANRAAMADYNRKLPNAGVGQQIPQPKRGV